MHKRILNVDTLGALYVSMYSLLAPLTHTVTGGSTVILGVALFLVLFLHTIIKYQKKVVSNYSFVFKTTFFVITLFLFDYAFRPNQDIGDLFYSFIIYGFFTLYFLASVSDYDKFLKSYCFFSIICGLIMLIDPIQNYAWSGGYMPFGFQFMLPAFAASIILSYYYHINIAQILSLIFFLMMLIFGNKGSILTSLLLFIVGVSYIKNGNKISRKVIFAAIFFVLFFFLAYKEVLDVTIYVVEKLGINSYALATIQIILEDTSSNSVYDTRINIWQDSLEFFSNAPILGKGIGFYRSQRGVYEHNLFLEVLNAWGIIGISVLLIAICKCFRSLLTTKLAEYKVLMIIFAILGFVPLMSSLTLWIHAPFWIFISFGMKKRHRKKLRTSESC